MTDQEAQKSQPETGAQPQAETQPKDQAQPKGQAQPQKLRTCPCGHDRKHYMVTAEPEYTVGGWCLLLIGVSARPFRLKYRCRQCEKVFDWTTDREALLYHV